MNNIYVSKYTSVSSPVAEKVMLFSELTRIKNGFYKQLINPCRQAYLQDKTQYRKLKSSLPAITFCGLFNGPHKADHLEHYNNLIVIDIDNLAEDQVTEAKNKLFSDEYTLACWLSPSGHGIKLLMQIQSNVILHKYTFDRILDHLFANYNIEADPCGSDVCRLCYISHDENLMLKETAKFFPAHDDEWLLEIMQKNKNFLGDKLKSNQLFTNEYINEIEKLLLFKTEGRNKSDDRHMAKKIITYLKKTGQTITENYQNWLKVGLSIANTFTYDVGKKIYLEICRLDGPLHDEYKSQYLLEYCYRHRRPEIVNFATIVFLAKQKNFIVNPISKIKGNSSQ